MATAVSTNIKDNACESPWDIFCYLFSHVILQYDIESSFDQLIVKTICFVQGWYVSRISLFIILDSYSIHKIVLHNAKTPLFFPRLGKCLIFFNMSGCIASCNFFSALLHNYDFMKKVIFELRRHGVDGL